MIFRGVRPHDNVGACARKAEKLRGENLQLFKEIVAIVGIYFHGEGQGKIEREDAENGFRVNHVFSALRKGNPALKQRILSLFAPFREKFS